MIASGYPPIRTTLQIGHGEDTQHDITLGHRDTTDRVR